jgi:hypothetical protein
MRCEYDPWDVFITIHFFTIYEWAQYARVLHITWLERLYRNKHSSLLGPFVSYNENKVL